MVERINKIIMTSTDELKLFPSAVNIATHPTGEGGRGVAIISTP